MGAELQEIPEPARALAIEAPAAEQAVAPGMGVQGAMILARAGNRAFAGALGAPAGGPPRLQRSILDALPEDMSLPEINFRDFIPKIGPFAPAAGPAKPAVGGAQKMIEGMMKAAERARIQDEMALGLRIRKQLNIQVLGQIETGQKLMEQKPPAAEAAQGVWSSAVGAVQGFGLPDRFDGQVEAMRAAIAEAATVAAAIGMPRSKIVASVGHTLDLAVSSLAAATADASAAGAPAPPGPSFVGTWASSPPSLTPPAGGPSGAGPAPAGPPGGAPAPAPAPGLTDDQKASLNAAADQIRVAKRTLGAGTHQQVDNALLILAEVPKAITGAGGSAPPAVRQNIDIAHQSAQGAKTYLETLTRSKEENVKAAVAASRAAYSASSTLFSSLASDEKTLKQRLETLDKEAAGAPAVPGAAPPPAP